MTRTITTAAELDALPWGAVVARTVFGEPGEDWHKRRDGMWLGTGGDVWAADLLAVASDHAHMALTLVVPVVPVVSDAAVEAGVGAARQRLTWPSLHWGECWIDPEAWPHVVRAALTAALPHLAATPYVVPEAVTRGLAQSAAGETVDLGDFTQYDATVPSATRDDVARALDIGGWDTPVGLPDGPMASIRAYRRESQRQAADRLLARFTITPRTDR